MISADLMADYGFLCTIKFMGKLAGIISYVITPIHKIYFKISFLQHLWKLRSLFNKFAVALEKNKPISHLKKF